MNKTRIISFVVFVMLIASTYMSYESIRLEDENFLLEEDEVNPNNLIAGDNPTVQKQRGTRWGGGNGTPGNPYQITDVIDLQNMSANLSAHYILVNDIDAGETSTWPGGFDPIGNDTTRFEGTFDGDGHVIQNLFIERPEIDFVGLFGCTDSTAEISNVTLNNANVTGNNSVGSLIGYNRGGTITNCISYGNITGMNQNTGGLIGYNDWGTVSNCSTFGITTGMDDHVGGLIGYTLGGTVESCFSRVETYGNRWYVGGLIGRNSGAVTSCNTYGNTTGLPSGSTLQYGGLIGLNSGPVTNCNAYGNTGAGTGNYFGGLIGRNSGTVDNCHNFGTTGINNNWVGGLIGDNLASGIVTNCSNQGDVFGETHTGGLIGYNTIGEIRNCYSNGDVDGNKNAGGLLGFNNIGLIENCYSHSDTNGNSYVGGLIGNNTGTVTNCYSKGLVSGFSFVGGLIGEDTGTATSCFWDNETSGQITSDAGAGKNTLDMMKESTFTGWDFNLVGDGTIGIWIMAGYPHLQMEHTKSIGDVVDMQLMAVDLTENYVLRNDIHAQETEIWNGGFGFLPVGNASTPFTGIFEGDGYTISDLYIYRLDYTGLFGVTENSLINNVSLRGINVTGNDYVGGLVGSNNGTINYCVKDGEIRGNTYVGGLVGEHETGTINNSESSGTVYNRSFWVFTSDLGGLVGCNYDLITNCHAEGEIVGGNFIGGLIGENFGNITKSCSMVSINSSSGAAGGFVGYNWGNITRCYSTGNLSSNGAYLGGFVGANEGWLIKKCYSTGFVNGNLSSINDGFGGFVGMNTALIHDCYCRGNVTGFSVVGGFAGYNFDQILDCYSTGNVTGDSNLGGFVAWTSDFEDGCYWDYESSGISTDESIVTFGRNTTEMMQRATFGIGWDFVTIWGIGENLTYPYLLEWYDPYVNITTGDVNITLEDNLYSVDFDADFTEYLNYPIENNLLWNLETKGTWLSLDPKTGELFGFPSNPDVGYFWVNISVSDYGGGASAFHNFTLNVVNTIPSFSNLPPPNSVLEDIPYFYDLNTTDEGWETLTWSMITNANWLSINDTTGVLTGTPDNSHVGTFWVNVTVDEGGGDKNSTNFTVMVVNVPSIITTSNPPTSVFEDSLYSYDFDSTDDGQGIITWSLNTNANWLSVDDTTGVLSGSPDNSHVGTFWVNVTVNDGNGGIGSINFTLTVENIPPSITTTNPPVIHLEDIVYSYDFESDDEGQGITIWSLLTNADWLDIQESSGALSGIPSNSHVGGYWVNVTFFDGNGDSTFINYTLMVLNVNDAPQITTTDITSAVKDAPYFSDYDAQDMDPTMDTLTWALKTNATWLSINESNGHLFGTPSNADIGGYWVNVTVSDGNEGFDSHNFTLTVTGENNAPIIEPVTPFDGMVGQVYILTINASDADSNILTWHLTSNATWLHLEDGGLLWGTPTASGSFWAEITVSDGLLFDSINITINIKPDLDYDGISDDVDDDIDGDGVENDDDAFPKDPNETTDTDGDGTGDNADLDDDGDNVQDVDDDFPLDPSEDTDTDEDGIGNNADLDDDNDGMPDLWETQNSLNPLDNGDADQDGDEDGLTNLLEYTYGSSPHNDDTDSDELPDAWEVLYGLNASDASDAQIDSDGDGVSNLDEYKGKSDPDDPGSVPKEEKEVEADSTLWIALSVVLIVIISIMAIMMIRGRPEELKGEKIEEEPEEEDAEDFAKEVQGYEELEEEEEEPEEEFDEKEEPEEEFEEEEA